MAFLETNLFADRWRLLKAYGIAVVGIGAAITATLLPGVAIGRALWQIQLFE